MFSMRFQNMIELFKDCHIHDKEYDFITSNECFSVTREKGNFQFY